jgi:RHS repeat-associated protein
VTLTYPDGRQVHYEYDAANRLVKVTDWAARVTKYDYNQNGRLIKTLRPNGTQQTRVYDKAGQLLQLKDIVIATGDVISQFDFRYDAAGNITQELVSPPPERFQFTAPVNMAYTANRLAAYNGEAVQFDADGNMTKGPLSGGLADFVFDSRNRLVAAGNTAYRYDAENQRIGVSIDGQETRYVINSVPVLSQVLVRTQPDGTQTYYVHGLGLIGQEKQGQYLSYHFDFRGSTVALTDETGQVVELFQYSPYGLLLSGDASRTPFLFNGRYGVMTDGNELYYMRARYYHPEIRRFVNQDVLLGNLEEGQTLNRYAYVTGQPVSFVDPFGLGALSYDPFFKELLGPDSILWTTETGLQWLWELASQELDVKVKLGRYCKAPITELIDEHGFPTSMDSQRYKPEYWLITIDPKRKMGLMGPEGPFIASLTRILVHELGHGVGAKDSGGAWYEMIPWFRSDDYMMDNVKQWENPWMKELGEKIPRIRYSPVTELCSCER